MAKAVIDIINGVRRLTLDSEITASDFDTSAESDIAQLRESFNTAYEYLIEKKSDDFRYEYDLTTVASQKAYSLPVSTEYLSGNTQVRLIDSTKGTSYTLGYLTESRVRQLYPNPEVDIEESKPYRWWVKTTDTAGTKEIRFIGTPDDIYTIRFTLQTVPSALTGANNTGCSRKGDEWLKLELASISLENRGFGQGARYKQAADEYFRQYIVNDLYTEHSYQYATPGFIGDRRFTGNRQDGYSRYY